MNPKYILLTEFNFSEITNHNVLGISGLFDVLFFTIPAKHFLDMRQGVWKLENCLEVYIDHYLQVSILN